LKQGCIPMVLAAGFPGWPWVLNFNACLTVLDQKLL
jgi:hypothetical protein